MARHRDFEGGIDLSEFEPLTFTLRGQLFEAKPAIQGSVLLDFVAKADTNSAGGAADALYSFFKEALPGDQYERFMTLLHDPNVIIDMEKIGEIANWLVEEYGKRPTRPSENSANGQMNSGHMSTVAQS